MGCGLELRRNKRLLHLKRKMTEKPDEPFIKTCNCKSLSIRGDHFFFEGVRDRTFCYLETFQRESEEGSIFFLSSPAPPKKTLCTQEVNKDERDLSTVLMLKTYQLQVRLFHVN